MNDSVNFSKYHKMGSHCLTSALRDIFEYNGIRLSEDMCLGLGSGCGFVYVRQADVCIFGGRGGNLENNICKILGINIKTLQTEDDDYAWAAVKKLIYKSIPVLLDVDMTYLHYLTERFQVTNDFRFGGHKLIIAGIDEENKQVYLYDYLWKNPQIVGIMDLKKARSSDIKPISPNNTWMTFDFPSQITPLHIAIRHAISYNVQQMLYPVGIGIGHKALVRFSREIRNWPKIMNPERLKREVFIAYMTFEKIGTGGGNFRRMYARFLREAEEILSMPELRSVQRMYTDLSNLWKEFSLRLEVASIELKDGNTDFFKDEETGRLLDDLSALEGKALHRLEELFER